MANFGVQHVFFRLLSKNGYGKQIIIAFISFLFASGIFLISQIDGIEIQIIMLSIILIIYFIFLGKKDIFIMIYYILYSSLFIYFIITICMRKFIGVSAVNFLYVIDIMLLFLFVRIFSIKKYVYKFLNDKFILMHLLLIIISSIYGLFNGSGLQNNVMVSWIYLRMLPVYIVLAYCKKSFTKKDIKFFLFLNVILMPILFLKFPQDDLAGLFGYCGNTAFSLIAVLILSYGVIKYMRAEISTSKFIVFFVSYFLWVALGENKFQLIFGAVVVFIAIIIIKLPNKYRGRALIYRTFLIILMPVCMVISVYLLLTVYEEWRYILDIGLKEFYLSYTQKANVSFYQLGRLQVVDYINQNVFKDIIDRFLGVGIGNGMPGVMTQFHVFDHVMKIGEHNYLELFNTRFYNNNSWSLGYHNSGIGILYLENGVIGVSLYIISIIIASIRCFKCLISKNSSIIIIGGIGIIFYLYWVSIFTFYNPIFETRCSFIYFIVSAWFTRVYNKRLIEI